MLRLVSSRLVVANKHKYDKGTCVQVARPANVLCAEGLVVQSHSAFLLMWRHATKLETK